MSVRTHRTRRTRLLAAAALTAAVLSLTACEDGGKGSEDEGADRTAPTASAAGGSGDGAGAEAGSDSGAERDEEEDKGTAAEAGREEGKGAAGDAAESRSVPCSSGSVQVRATTVSRPVNHLLLTLTNTGSRACDLVGHPAVRFGEAQAVPPVFEESKPQAVVTLAPGESGYAGVRLSAADGGGAHGHTVTTLSVHLGENAGAVSASLPAKGVYVDDSLTVTYWQSDMEDALAW